MEEIEDFPQLLMRWLRELTPQEGREQWMTSRPSSN
jgi:hypothetical protein